ncbi:MAG: hypothetical protein IKI58_03505 [Oscillospiraceae bacterium]|nr:hypothetical protein [Oscillospiraceae bacterium]
MTVSKWFLPALSAGITVIAAGAAVLPHRAAGQYELPEVSLGAEEAGIPATLRENPADSGTDQVPDLPEKDYVIKLSEGRILVYESGKREPAASYETEEPGLPDYDRILLEYGIRVTGEEALREVLEDYVS